MVLRAHLAAALALGLLVSGPARAETSDHAETLKEIQGLTGEAAAAFESYSYRKAQGKLERALALAATAGISRDPKLAEVHVMLGVAAVAGTNDLYRGLHAFVQALRLNPKVQIPKKVVTPQLSEMFARARQTVAQIGKPPTVRLARVSNVSTPEKTQKSTASGLAHAAIDTAKRGYPIVVKAEAGADIQAQRVLLFYRKPGTVQFTELPMQKSESVFRTSIPAEATYGRYVHYYLEARDARGRLAASFGSARSPSVVIIE
jgi:hypothetical protein